MIALFAARPPHAPAAPRGGDKHAAIVLYCRSGARSAVATKLLHDRGFTQVTDIGPMGNWDTYRARAR